MLTLTLTSHSDVVQSVGHDSSDMVLGLIRGA